MSEHHSHRDRPPSSQRGFLSTLSAFMESRNIFWGELIGGLLVIGCALALVISLWDTFRENPVFRLLTFTGATVSLLLVGVYTSLRWSLESTSKGLLWIGLLLVPIQLLGLTLPGRTSDSTTLEILLVFVSLVVLGWPVLRASRILAEDGPWSVTLGLLLTTLCQVPVAWLLGESSDRFLYLWVALLPVACHVGASVPLLRRYAGQPSMELARVRSLLVYLGVTLFALVVVLTLVGLLGAKVPSLDSIFAIPIALAGLPLLTSGALIHNRLGRVNELASAQGGYRTTGTILALIGMVIEFAVLWLAWPVPSSLCFVALFLAITLMFLAFTLDVPFVHALSIPCAVFAYLLGVGLVGGFLSDTAPALARAMVRYLASAPTGLLLLVPLAVSMGLMDILERREKPLHRLAFAIAASLLTGISLLSLTLFGIDQPWYPFVGYGLLGASMLLFNVRWQRVEVSYAALGLLVGASFWALLLSPLRSAGTWGLVFAIEASIVYVWGRLQQRWGSPLPWEHVSVACVFGACCCVFVHFTHTIWSEVLADFRHAITLVLLTVWAYARVKTEENLVLAKVGTMFLFGFLVFLGWRTNAAFSLMMPRTLAAWGLSLIALLFVSLSVWIRSEQRWLTMIVSSWGEFAQGIAGIGLFALVTNPPNPILCVPGFALVICACLWTWQHRQAHMTHAALLLLLVAFGELFSYTIARFPAQTLGLVFLGHATLALSLGFFLTRKFTEDQGPDAWILEPLRHWVMISSILAVLPLSFGLLETTSWLALESLWLTGLWLALAVLGRSPGWFFAFQTALLFTVILLANVLLTSVSGSRELLVQGQIYGLALGVYTLAATLTRRAIGENSILRDLQPTPLSLDRGLFSVLLVGQTLLFGLGLLPSVWSEITNQSLSLTFATALDAKWAWGLLLLLTVNLALDRKHFATELVLSGCLILLLGVCFQGASYLAAQHSGASALSWTLVLGFGLCSISMWSRDSIRRWFQEKPTQPPESWRVDFLRTAIIVGMALPVLALLVARVWFAMVGMGGLGPDVGSVFDRFGKLANGIGPSALVCVGLWGYALRERRSEYAFVVCLIVSGLASLIFLFEASLTPSSLGWWLSLFRTNALVLTAMGFLWLACRHWLSNRTLDHKLFDLEVLLCSLVHGTILALLLVPIVLQGGIRTLGNHIWLTNLAMAGWAALLVAYSCTRNQRGISISGVLGLAGCILLAWNSSRFLVSPWTSLQTLQLGLLALATGLVTWGRRSQSTDRSRDIEATLWYLFLALSGAVVLLLGLREPPLAPWWTCGGIVILALQHLVYAKWKRSESAVLTSVVGLHAALAIVQLYFLLVRHTPWTDLAFASSHLILAALCGLVWTVAHRRNHNIQRLDPLWVPLLTSYITVLVVGRLALAVAPLWLIVSSPAAMSPWVLQAGNSLAWVSLLLTILAVATFTWGWPRDWSEHLLGILGTALAVTVASTAAHFDTGNWLAFHVLQISGLVLASITLTRAWLQTPSIQTEETKEQDLDRFKWCGGLVLLVAGLTARTLLAEPFQPWWTAGFALAISFFFALFAVWRRDELWALYATIGLNATVAIPLVHFHRIGLWNGDLPTYCRAFVLTTMLASAVWLLIGRALSRRGKEYGHPLLHSLIGLGILATLYLLVYPTVALIWDPVNLAAVIPQTGTLLSLCCLVSVAAVCALKFRPRGGWRIMPASMAGFLLGGVLTACVVSRWDTGNWLSYRVLASFWTLAGPGLLVLGWFWVRKDHNLPPSDTRKLLRQIRWWTDGCVAALGLAGILLAVRAFLGDVGLRPWVFLWIGAITLESALLALWRRSETWAVLTTVGIDLLVSLWLWDAPPLNEKAPFWMWLVQANVLSTTLAGLLWLVASRRIYGEDVPSPREAPLLSFQLLLTIVGNGVLLLNPSFLDLLRDPGHLSSDVAAADGVWGWLTFGLTTLTVFVYLRMTKMHEAIHVLGTLGMGAGILAACTAASYDHGQWLTYHVLMVSWTLVGTAILVGGWITSPLQSDSTQTDDAPWISLRVVQGWLIASGLPVLALALRGVLYDPAGAWWSSGVIATMSILAALLGIWRRRVLWTSLAGLGVNLSLSLALWRGYQHVPFAEWGHLLLQLNILALASMALLWMLLLLKLDRTSPFAKQSFVCLDVQLCLAGIALIALLSRAGYWLIRTPAPLPEQARQATSPLLWAGLLVSLIGWRALAMLRGRVLSSGRISLSGLCLALAVACAVGTLAPSSWLGYHTLLCCVAGVTVVLAAHQRENEHRGDSLLFDPTNAWLALWGTVLILLGLRSGLVDASGPWWSAGAILVAAVVFALLAWRRRRDSWAFFSGLTVMLAVSLVFVRFHWGESFAHWRIELVQLNVLTASLVGLLWLAYGHRLYTESTRAWGEGWFLAQLSLLALGNLALWIAPAYHLIHSPGTLNDVIVRTGTVMGWLTLSLSLVPVCWHMKRVLHDRTLDALVVIAMGGNILLACTVARLTGDAWLAYRTLTFSVASLAGVLLAIGWRTDPKPHLVKQLLGWIILLSLAVVALGLWSVATNPSLPQGPASSLLLLAALWVGLGAWRNRDAFVFFAGLLFVAGVVGWTWPYFGYSRLAVQAYVGLVAFNVWTLLWFGLLNRLIRHENHEHNLLLEMQSWIGFALSVMPLLLVGFLVILSPTNLPSLARVPGTFLAGVSLTLALLAVALYLRQLGKYNRIALSLLGLLTLILFTTCAVEAWFPHTVYTYRTLLIGLLVVGFSTLGMGFQQAQLTRSPLALVKNGTAFCFSVVILLALRTAGLVDAHAIWWSVGSILVVSLGATGLTLYTHNQRWSLTGCLGVHLALTLWMWQTHLGLSLEDWGMALLQRNGLVGALCALLWMALHRDASTKISSVRGGYLFALVLLAVGMLVLPITRLILTPAALHPSVRNAGSPLGWLSVTLTFLAILWHGGTRMAWAGHALRYPLALALGGLVACTLSPWDTGDWLVYHILVFSWAVVAFFPLASAYVNVRRENIIAVEPVHFWSCLLGSAVLLLVTRGVGADPYGMWWYSVALLAVACLAGALVFFLLSPEYGLVSFGLLAWATYLILHVVWDNMLPQISSWMLASCGAALVWVFVEPRTPRRFVSHSWIDAVIGVLLIVFCILVGWEVFRTLESSQNHIAQSTWMLAGLLGVLLLASFWDSLAPEVPLRLFVWTLTLLVLGYAIIPQSTRWVTLPILSSLILFVERLRSQEISDHWQTTLRIPSRRNGWSMGWVSWAQRFLSLFVVCGSVVVVLSFDQFLRRLGGPLALCVLLPAMLLASRRHIESDRAFTYGCVLLLIPTILGQVLWASLDANGANVWLERLGFLLTMSALFHFVYQLLPSLSEVPTGEWTQPLRRTSLTLAGVAGMLLLLLMLGELTFVRGGPGLPFESSLAIGLGIALLVASCLCLAIVPKTSPVPLSETQRQGIVYLAEFFAVLLYLHVRFTQPHLFSGRFSSMWTYVAIVFAFVLAGLGEMLRRVRLGILAKPLMQTSLLLGLVPVLGYAFRPAGNYAVLWLLVSLLYAIVAMSRQSTTLGVLSAMFANCGFWAYLSSGDRSIQTHPQLWLVPLSITILLGAHLNRDRLRRGQLNALRYLALTMMYLASAWETFLIGLGEDVTRPLILIGLALAGVCLGMVLRIRAFLFLGVAFIFLGVFALIWHAAVRQAWIWYAAGIVLGFAIIAIFAVFEKRRKDILTMLEKLREWE